MHDETPPHSTSTPGGTAGVLTRSSSGVWCLVGNSAMLGALARSAFDWIALDAQHGEFDRRALIDAGRMLASGRHAFAVRVGSVDAEQIGFALDIGASTVIVPQVDTADDARRSVAAALYPPAGARSWGPLIAMWGLRPVAAADAAPQVAVMIESEQALANVREIASVPGVDLLFVGPFDLAISLGIALDDLLDDERGPLATIRHAAEAAGIGAAAFAGTPERARILRDRGFDCLAVATDMSVIAAGADWLLGEMQ